MFFCCSCFSQVALIRDNYVQDTSDIKYGHFLWSRFKLWLITLYKDQSLLSNLTSIGKSNIGCSMERECNEIRYNLFGCCLCWNEEK